MQVWWRSGHLSARRSDLRKSLQTDRRTDDVRRAIALAHSWNAFSCKKNLWSDISDSSDDVVYVEWSILSKARDYFGF